MAAAAALALAPWMNATNSTMSHCVLDSPISIADLDTLRLLGYVLSACGVALCLPLLVFKLCIAEYRAFPARITTLFIAACTAFHAVVLLGAAFVADWDFEYYRVVVRGQKPSPFCLVQGVLFQFFACTMIWLWCLVAFVMYLVVVKGYSFERIGTMEKKFHLLWFGMSVMQTIIPCLVANWPAEPQLGAPYCWISDQDDQLIQISFFTSEMFVALVVGLCFCFKVLFRFVELSGAGSGNDRHSLEFAKVIRGYVWRHSMFAVGFASVFITIAFFVTNQIFANAGVWCVSYTAAVLHVVSVSGSGIISFAVLGPTRSNLQMICRKCTSPVSWKTENRGAEEEFSGLVEDRDEEAGGDYGSFPG
jgi:hypothetical protein